jgi:hypothetical protein
MKKISISKNGIEIDNIEITNIASNIIKNKFDNFDSPIKKFNLEYGYTLFVLDTIGIRFWAKNNKITQTQVFLNKMEDEKFPVNSFDGQLLINKLFMNAPIKVEDLEKIGATKIIKDDDSLRFGINMYEVYLENKKYTFQADKSDEFIDSIYD